MTEGEELTADEIAAGSCITRGISSVVLAGPEEQPRSLGHTMLLDLDDADTVAAFECFGSLASEGGVTALLQSSRGSFHLWDLSVRDLDTQLLKALRTPSEALHVKQSANRGRFILRAAPKWRSAEDSTAGERYKEAPQVLRVEARPTDIPQSQPHLEALGQLHGTPIGEVVDLDPVAGLWVGERVVQSDYVTVDDDLKERW